ncbi:methionine aminopeptidase type I [Hydrogenispora ethanolica]|jgi:methionyl aminopeptidase|uniref:Methionine aminopeptidase n=1 Tax=Hydrogenispora ethanolica TaxID=1082276 RepID=A0A4R1S3M9_HYDET|nr:type I methionyl aminopeptidase [Hydrogenispora ethanolica]TCL73240.1 methionine aminopeptidase type I [Hydrogenispora ethanolica]
MNTANEGEACWCGSGLAYAECHREIERKAEEYRKKGWLIPGRGMIKTPAQLAGIRESGRLTRRILDLVGAEIRPGVTTAALDRWVHRYTLEQGAYPAPLGYRGFPKSVCISVNEVICHGIPDERQVLREGDIVNIDVTTILNGFYADASRMYSVGAVSPAAARLVRVAKEAMERGIAQVKPFQPLDGIGNAIEPFVRSHGYSVVRDLGGHGVGLAFHEALHVDHFAKRSSGYLLLPGMVFTVEPMINAGGPDCRYLDDGWTVLTRDGALSAQWEHTVAVTRDGVEILT